MATVMVPRWRPVECPRRLGVGAGGDEVAGCVERSSKFRRVLRRARATCAQPSFDYTTPRVAARLLVRPPLTAPGPVTVTCFPIPYSLPQPYKMQPTATILRQRCPQTPGRFPTHPVPPQQRKTAAVAPARASQLAPALFIDIAPPPLPQHQPTLRQRSRKHCGRRLQPARSSITHHPANLLRVSSKNITMVPTQALLPLRPPSLALSASPEFKTGHRGACGSFDARVGAVCFLPTPPGPDTASVTPATRYRRRDACVSLDACVGTDFCSACPLETHADHRSTCTSCVPVPQARSLAGAHPTSHALP
ncbi:hypothetical protein HYPSUDRAFT_200119 [Hypholoma sublateritium FD-334 SS-4]|uniref:Uncharacterized protein n=1 Tax=Hypholoma sublateritium (strain FD-334 SS-4) TaxID=945553 RepID=A0A0D2P877_HYPSF|nr:hypothetical protein HYPSUDRAFT_200119 [Hypholoma sublateritium FD-334 SS-4]